MIAGLIAWSLSRRGLVAAFAFALLVAGALPASSLATTTIGSAKVLRWRLTRSRSASILLKARLKLSSTASFR
jgi:hypothetical protein